MPATQTRRKRRLGAYLRDLREHAGKRHEDVASRLDCSDSAVSRLENGWSVPSRGNLETLLAYYGASDAERDEALTRWADAKQDSARVELAAAVPLKLRPLLRVEADASHTRIISPTVIHGLLQTERYARAITLTGDHVGAVADPARFVEARLRRQRRLTGTPPLRVDAILDEACLRRMVGGRAVMREQLEHLVTLGRRANVTIRVLPLVAGAYVTMTGPVDILSYPDDDDGTSVYLEYPGGGEWVEDAENVAKFEMAFDATARAALSAIDTAAFLAALTRELGS